MNADALPAPGPGDLRGVPALFRQAGGLSLAPWAAIALLQVATQIVFRRNLLPGEFATLNTLLAVIGLLTVPVFALHVAFVHFHPRETEPDRVAKLHAARVPVLQAFALLWAFLSLFLLAAIFEWLSLPRSSFDIFTLLNVLAAVAAIVGAALCTRDRRLPLWGILLVSYAVARLALALVLTRLEPWADSGLGAGLLAGFITLVPLLHQHEVEWGWAKIRAILPDREFLTYFAATLSLLLGLFLFTNGDRLVAQVWFGRSGDNNMGYVHWGLFDGYQTAGLLGRALLWGTQPLLWILLVQRASLARTPRTLLPLLGLYIGALVAAAIVLALLAQPLSRLFGGGSMETTAYFIPAFAGAMIPLGLLQGVGFFALASRRLPECFVLGAASIAYVIFLDLVARPQLMLSCIFGGGIVALMLVLFVGVVRWGRLQP